MSASLLLSPICHDITLYSIVGLTARLNGCDGRAISQLLFGSPYAGLRHDFPSNLDHFCSATQGRYGEPACIVSKFTTIPYFLRFRSSPSSEEALQNMRGGSVERLKFALGLPPCPTGALLPMRHCMECARNDLNQFGFAYWHREHQLPSTLVCPEHGCALHEAGIRADGTGWTSLHLPLDSRDHGESSAPLIDRPTALFCQLAKLGGMSLRSDRGDMSAATLHQAYLHGMKQNGLLTRTGQVRATAFVARFERTYQALVNVRPFDRIVAPRCAEGMLRLVRKPRSPANPISHLLLIHFLFGTWDLFNAVVSWEGHMGPSVSLDAPSPAPPCHIPTGPSAPAHLIGHLSTISQKVAEGNISLSKACREEGVDVGTAMRWLGKLGQPVPKRPKKLNDGMLSEARRLLDDGLPLVLIGDQLELSESTIDRICSESPEQMQRWKAANLEWKREKYRQAFLSAIAAEPTITRGQLRKLEGGGFSWLSRHDRAWLTERLPVPYSTVARPPIKRRPRVDWEARDAECARAIAQLAFDFQLQSWERIKPPAILRRLPKLSFSPRLDRLPKSRAMIVAILERLNRETDGAGPRSVH